MIVVGTGANKGIAAYVGGLANASNRSDILISNVRPDIFQGRYLKSIGESPLVALLNFLNLPLFVFLFTERVCKGSVVLVVSSCPFNIILVLFLRIRGYKIIFHLHDPIPHDRGFKRAIIFWVNKMFCWAADQVIISGTRIAKTACRSGLVPRGKIKVAYFPAQISISEFEELRKRVLKDSFLRSRPVPRVTFIGRITRYKGLQHFINLAVGDSKSEFEWMIAGQCMDAESARLLKDAERNSRVRVVNRSLDHAEFLEIIFNSTAVVLPYVAGTQSGVMPICRLLQVPVLFSDVGSLKENSGDLDRCIYEWKFENIKPLIKIEKIVRHDIHDQIKICRENLVKEWAQFITEISR